ncbi:hypothetical protein F4821DRAFT_187563 [Hypoxylon rubiginosum]|uniref:Uncharacterized protein n=1 Tax=Hypoxylon rubiginosum TaxID=110542 RepID=A0ACC0DFU8_9PEZI|nr:hypothetical protein F4821DRAFT_187563 [Hypoxylon rubiginosum]
MAYHFPKKISAARIATFVSTAAWIQGTSASEVSLPEDALNNFLRRHGVVTVSPRQTNGTAEDDGQGDDEEEDDEEEGEESVDSVSSSSVDTPGAPPSVSTDSDSESTPSIPPDSAQAGLAQGASGQPGIGSPDPPALSMGAKVAIGVWSAVGVIAIAGLVFFFYRRRRRARLAQEQVNALRDEELARSQEAMSQRMSGPYMPPLPPPPPQSAVMEPVYLRGGGDGGSAGSPGLARNPSIYAPSINRNPSVGAPSIARNPSVRAPTVREPSGQWMPVPPWQEDAPTWRDSQPWRQSPPSVAGAPIGLPSSVRPIVPLQTSKPEMDRRTEYTADTESTIFAYR